MNDAPHIWTRRPKILEPKAELICRPELQGWWRLKAIRPDGQVREDTGWFPNLLLDVGLDIMGRSSNWLTTCHVGTSNATPSVSDTGLIAQVATTSTTQDVVAASNQTADRYCYARKTFRFSAGSAAGNLAEIGISNTQSITRMLSRALILDGGGSATTITVLPDEVLDATYEIRGYPSLTDVVTTVLISGVTYNVTIRSSEVDSLWDMVGGGLGSPVGWLAGTCTNGANVYPSTSTLGTVLTSPSGTGSSSSSGANSTYTDGTYYRDFSYTWGLSNGNVSGGIAAARICSGSQASGGGEGTSGQAIQISFSPVIPKTSSNNLVLNFRQQWARRTI